MEDEKKRNEKKKGLQKKKGKEKKKKKQKEVVQWEILGISIYLSICLYIYITKFSVFLSLFLFLFLYLIFIYYLFISFIFFSFPFFSLSPFQGPIFNFNLLDVNGDFFGFYDVALLASSAHISLRTGCACNPGACYSFLRVPRQLIKDTVANIPNNACGQKLDIVSGYPIGSIRVSFGYLSTFEDAYYVLHFFRSTLLNKSTQQFADEMALRDIDKDQSYS